MNASHSFMWNFRNTPLAFATGGTEKMTLTTSGLLGIGTTSPAVELDIYDSTGNSAIRLGGGAVNNEAYQIQQGIDGVSNGGFAIRNVTNGSNPFVIQYSTENVGIGHTSPKSQLSIVGTGADNNYSGVIGIENTSSAKWGYISFTDDIDAVTHTSNYYIIGRGQSFADRQFSFHIPITPE